MRKFTYKVTMHNCEYEILNLPYTNRQSFKDDTLEFPALKMDIVKMPDAIKLPHLPSGCYFDPLDGCDHILQNHVMEAITGQLKNWKLFRAAINCDGLSIEFVNQHSGKKAGFFVCSFCSELSLIFKTTNGDSKICNRYLYEEQQNEFSNRKDCEHQIKLTEYYESYGYREILFVEHDLFHTDLIITEYRY